MNQYKFYFVDDHGHIFKAEDHLLRDDLAALSAAKNLSSPHVIEIWQGARSIARVEQSEQVLDASNRQAL